MEIEILSRETHLQHGGTDYLNEPGSGSSGMTSVFSKLELSYIGFAAQPNSEKLLIVQTTWRWRWQDSDFYDFHSTGTFFGAIISSKRGPGPP